MQPRPSSPSFCAQWAGAGECHKNPSFMLKESTVQSCSFKFFRGIQVQVPMPSNLVLQECAKACEELAKDGSSNLCSTWARGAPAVNRSCEWPHCIGACCSCK